jgi:hypothetical protein
MNKFTYMLAGASMLAITGIASAEPVALSATQMDGVTAGATTIYIGAAGAQGLAAAVGNNTALTATVSGISLDPNGTGVVVSGASGTGVAISSFLPGAPNNGAAAVSTAVSVASIL